MIQKFPIKTICALVLLIFALWLWQVTSSNDRDSDASLVSSISAVSEAQAQDPVSSGRVLLVNNDLDEQLARRLSATTQLIDNGQVGSAVSELKEIIKAQPNAVEPYINLAALYAKSKDIELARETLLDGIKVNKNTAVLFDSLQKVYAAQASLSYQRALEIDTVSDDSLVLNLPKIDTLSLNQPSELEAELKKGNRALSVRVEELEKKQSELQLSLKSLEQEKNVLNLANADLKKQYQDQESAALLALQQDNSRLSEQVSGVNTEREKLKIAIQSLQEENIQLSLANTDLNNNASLKSDTQAQLNQELSSLKDSNTQLQKQLGEMEQAQTQLQSDIAALQAKNDTLALTNSNFETKLNQQLSTESSNQQAQTQLQRQLSDTKALLAQSEQHHREQLAQLERDSDSKVQALQAQLAKENTNVVVSVVQPELTPTKEESAVKAEVISREQLKDVAIDLVKSWAVAWAGQNVPSYLSHYVSDFRPDSGLSHSQWREQRRVRLTNKTFINVDVSNFSVKDQDDKFTVSFVQHYRSNNVDDRIQKQLVFLKNSADWSDAKIVVEQVITQ